MNKTNDLLENNSAEELNEMKKWLFKESVRIQMEKQDLLDLQDTLQEEKRNITIEKESLKRKMEYADKRRQQDEFVLGEKQKILENGFRQLSSDKKEFQAQQQQLEEIKNSVKENQVEEIEPNMFFYGVNSSLALRKRYKDLLKIYHPDNTCGNEEVLIAITREYELLKKRYYEI